MCFNRQESRRNTAFNSLKNPIQLIPQGLVCQTERCERLGCDITALRGVGGCVYKSLNTQAVDFIWRAPYSCAANIQLLFKSLTFLQDPKTLSVSVIIWYWHRGRKSTGGRGELLHSHGIHFQEARNTAPKPEKQIKRKKKNNPETWKHDPNKHGCHANGGKTPESYETLVSVVVSHVIMQVTSCWTVSALEEWD